MNKDQPADSGIVDPSYQLSFVAGKIDAVVQTTDVDWDDVLDELFQFVTYGKYGYQKTLAAVACGASDRWRQSQLPGRRTYSESPELRDDCCKVVDR